MALVLKDRVKETTTTTGTGTITLAGAVTGYQAFSAIGNGNTTYYAIEDADGAGWEVGIGTYTLSGTTLARTTVLASTNSDSQITLSSGTHTVFCGYPAGKSVVTDSPTLVTPALGTPSALVATNATGTAASLTAGTATLATDATSITVSANDSTDETVYPLFVDGATGSQGAETDTGLTYNPSSGLLTSTLFAGALTGNVTGNASGSSGSCTGNAATVTTNANLTGHITSTGNAAILGSFTVAQLSTALSDASISGSNTGDQTTVSGSSGSCTGNAATATLATDATSITVSANDSTNETVYPLFVDGATGSQGAETDTGLTYNPSSGLLTSTLFAGALTGNVTGDASGSSGSCTGNAATATVATTVTITDNESTNENNAIIFTAGGDLDGGNLGLESDGDLYYNPSTGTVTATIFAGALTGNAATVTTNANLTGHITSTGNAAILGSFTVAQLSTALSDASISGNNTGDQTTVSGSSGSCTGNAATATALAASRTIGMTGDVVWTSASFDGTGNVTGTATIQADSVDGTMIAIGSDAQGDIMYYTGSDWARLGAGTSGHYLKTQGTSANPVWASVGGGTATAVTVADESTDTTCFPLFVTAATGDLGPKSVSSLSFNSNTGALTATTFVGALTGNVTGNASGTAATVTGGTQASITSAANLVTIGTIGTGVWQGTAIDGTYIDIEGTEVKSTGEGGGSKFLREDGDGTCSWQTVSAGTATAVTVADESSDTTCFPLFVTAATGDLGPKSGSNLTFNSSTGVLTATGFAGPLTGNVTGNTSGSSGSCTGNSATATLASTVTVTDSNSNTDFPVVFHDESNALLDDTGVFEYNPNTGTVTATVFSGSGASLTSLNGSNISSGTVAAARVATLNQDTTGTAAIATTVTVADESSDTTCFPLFVTDDTGNLAPKSGSNLTFNSSSGVLTAAGFAGPLTGNVTGNTSGSSGSCTGNAATATALASAVNIGGTSFDGTSSIVPGTITVADTTDTTSYVALFESATGDLAPKTDAGITYNAGTGTLTATAFAGPLTGNVTGNASGTAATVTGGTQAAITTLANVTTVGTIGTGVWQGTAIDGTYIDIEGTEVKSTGEGGGSKFLREDGDGTCSWQTVSAGTATAVTVADESSDTTCFPLFVTAATGDLGPKSGSNLTFNSSNGVLTATGFAGPITGNVTGNASGTSLTVTQAAQSAITSVGTLTALTVDNIIIDGTTIGHTSDGDLMTLVSGGLTLAGTLTVGANTAGHDVKLFGNTSGSYLEWDESEDRLHLVGGAYVNQPVPATGTTTEDATVTLDLSLGNYFNVLLGADVTAVEFTNATIGQRFIVRFVQVIGATDGYSISWSTVRIDGSTAAELKWAGNITPTMTGVDDQTHRGHKDVYGFLCTATGGSANDTKFDGFIIGQDLPD